MAIKFTHRTVAAGLLAMGSLSVLTFTAGNPWLAPATGSHRIFGGLSKMYRLYFRRNFLARPAVIKRSGQSEDH
jgi:hypothetical protein